MAELDWNRHHDWVLLRSVSRSESVAVRVGTPSLSAESLRRIRRAVPELRNLPPQTLLERISTSGRLDLGRRSLGEAAELAASAARTGITLERRVIEETD
jgi:hypothetical protein